jgi:voltage-gated potassium channel
LKHALNQFKDAFVKGRFSLLLLTLAVMFFVLPLVSSEQIIIDKLLTGFGIVVVISCLRAVIVTRGMLVFIISLCLLNVVFSGMDYIDPFQHKPAVVLELSLRLLYYGIVFLAIMRHVLRSKKITTDIICGAISAYFLIGIIWALIYALFYVGNPNSFSLPAAMVSDQAWGMWTLYFSFTSLTTLGYGDITPLTQAVQTYAYLEAACGQIFLTVLIARLVALHIIHENKKDQ